MIGDVSAFVLEQVAKSGRAHVSKHDCVLIQCPVHANGQERTPSRKINISNPKFRPLESFCYGCNDDNKRLTWNELAALTNMAPVREEDDAEESEDGLWLQLPTAEEFYGAESEQISHYKWKGDWKRDGVTISEKFLRKLKASLVNSRDEPRLYLPVYVDEEEVGNVQCVIDKNDESSKIKYLISGKWSQYTLYPIDLAFPLAEKLGYIVIVEGARDALNLMQHGVPCVCIWGTNGWTRAKLDILIDLGVKVIIAMDGDEPGQDAKVKIEADLKRFNVRYSSINFDEDMDPGKLKKREVLELKSMLDRKPVKMKATNDNMVDELLRLFRKRRYG